MLILHIQTIKKRKKKEICMYVAWRRRTRFSVCSVSEHLLKAEACTRKFLARHFSCRHERSMNNSSGLFLVAGAAGNFYCPFTRLQSDTFLTDGLSPDRCWPHWPHLVRLKPRDSWAKTNMLGGLRQEHCLSRGGGHSVISAAQVYSVILTTRWHRKTELQQLDLLCCYTHS